MENVDSQASFSEFIFGMQLIFESFSLSGGVYLRNTCYLCVCVVVVLEYTLICNINTVCVRAHMLC